MWCYAEASSRIRRARLAASASPRDATNFTAKRSEVGSRLLHGGRSVGRSIGRTDGRTEDSWGGPRRVRIIGGVFARAESGSRAVCPRARASSRRCAKSPRTPRVCACDLVHAPGSEVGCQRTRAAGYTLEEPVRGTSEDLDPWESARDRERGRERGTRAEPISRKRIRPSRVVVSSMEEFTPRGCA